jgi:hypothetical protein
MTETCKANTLLTPAELLILDRLLLLTSIYVLRGVAVQDVAWRTFLIYVAPILNVVEKERKQQLHKNTL